MPYLKGTIEYMVRVKEILAEQLLIYVVNPVRIWLKIHRAGICSRQKRKSLKRWLKQLEDEVIILERGIKRIGDEIRRIDQRKAQLNNSKQRAIEMINDAQPVSFKKMVQERTGQIESMKLRLDEIKKGL